MRLDQARQGHRDDHESRVAEPACLVLCRCEGRRRQSHHVGLLQCAARSADAGHHEGCAQDRRRGHRRGCVPGTVRTTPPAGARPTPTARTPLRPRRAQNESPMDRFGSARGSARLHRRASDVGSRRSPANGKRISPACTPPSTVKGTGPRGNLIFNADKMAPVKPAPKACCIVRAPAMRGSTSRGRCACRRASVRHALHPTDSDRAESQAHRDHPRAPAGGADHPDRRPGAPQRDRAFVTRRFSRQVGRRHTRHRDRQLQAVDPGRLPLHGSDQEPLAHRCASHHRTSDAQRKHAAVPHHHRRPQDLLATLLAGFRADAPARLGDARSPGVPCARRTTAAREATAVPQGLRSVTSSGWCMTSCDVITS